MRIVEYQSTKCPKCHRTRTEVRATRPPAGGRTVTIRYHICPFCGERFKSWEQDRA